MKQRKRSRLGESMASGTVVLTNHRSAPPITIQPQTSMYAWRIIEFDDARLLVGLLENGFTCRLTTEIVSIDFSARQVRTSSGRLYELLGPPASDSERLTVITAYLVTSIGFCWTDTTDSVWTAMCRTAA